MWSQHEQIADALAGADRDDGLRFHIWMVHPSGSHLEQLTFVPDVLDARPTLSPDGRTLAFSQAPVANGATCGELWVLDLWTRRERQVTFGIPHGQNAYNPTWSPDGRSIAFNRREGPNDCGGPVESGPETIWVVTFRPRIGVPQPLTAAGPSKAWPSWSPDGERVLFAEQTGSGCAQFTTQSIDVATRIESPFVPHVSAYAPRYSPDGSRIAWIDACANSVLAAEVGRAGDSGTPVTGPGFSEPAWSPNGKRLVVTFGPDSSHHELWSVRLDGTGLVQITSASYDASPWWGVVRHAKRLARSHARSDGTNP